MVLIFWLWINPYTMCVAYDTQNMWFFSSLQWISWYFQVGPSTVVMLLFTEMGPFSSRKRRRQKQSLDLVSMYIFNSTHYVFQWCPLYFWEIPYYQHCLVLKKWEFPLENQYFSTEKIRAAARIFFIEKHWFSRGTTAPIFSLKNIDFQVGNSHVFF